MASPPQQPDGLVDALVQTSFATMAVLNRVAAEHDLSLTLLRVGGILRDRRLRMAELADFLGLEKSTLSGLVERAERRGLVRRAPSAGDGRAVEVTLTSEGKALTDQVHAAVTAALGPLTSRLGPTEAHRLEQLLGRLTEDPSR